MKRTLLIIGIALVTILVVSAAIYLLRTRPSPAAETRYETPQLNIEVSYSQPSKRGREIFGGLVPYGEVWRTGANEATEVTFNKDVLFGGSPLPSGTYSLFTIPREDQWTIIINEETGISGTNYDESKDVLRIEAPAENLQEEVEVFTINVEENPQGANLILLWDQTSISVPVIPQAGA
ncbi:DUF2911 domain-containing protein [soil metagenome]